MAKIQVLLSKFGALSFSSLKLYFWHALGHEHKLHRPSGVNASHITRRLVLAVELVARRFYELGASPKGSSIKRLNSKLKKKSHLKFERKFRRMSETIKNNFGCMPCISCAINAGERTSNSWLSVWCPCKALDHQRSKEEFYIPVAVPLEILREYRGEFHFLRTEV